MNKLSVGVVFMFTILRGVGSAQLIPPASSVIVHNLAFRDRTMNVLVALAERYKIVIGVDGTLVGGDSAIINVSLEDGTLKDVLDAIVNQDPRFEWHQGRDAGIRVLIRESPLPLADITVSSFDSENLKRLEAVKLLARLPEVSAWLAQHNCSMDEIIAGPPPKDWAQFSVHIKEKPLSSVFDEIAAKSNTYFWSAIQYSNQPCAISVRP